VVLVVRALLLGVGGPVEDNLLYLGSRVDRPQRNAPPACRGARSWWLGRGGRAPRRLPRSSRRAEAQRRELTLFVWLNVLDLVRHQLVRHQLVRHHPMSTVVPSDVDRLAMFEAVLVRIAP
jgi:hypothetical protein